ncbi:MAG: SAM-dependent methyltransferase [Paracoccaceae bacterium]
MTPLAALLIQHITAAGPITVADYMAECLMHPQHGYYSTRDPFGRAGDFTTAPEISQMYGELLGLCLAQSWLDQGAPSPFTLAELGPGRGTLMADVLRATRHVPGFHAAAQVHLLEASPTLRAVQATTLGAFRVIWLNSIDALPEQPLFLLANEFFDALPIHQFQRDDTGWRQRMVGVVDGTLGFGLSDLVPSAMVGALFANDPPGTTVEVCPALRPFAATIAHRIHHHGGTAIIVDYGGWRAKGDTLQALRAHAPEHPLAHPGAADLTAHVDFEALALALQGLPHSPLTAQGDLLTRLGIHARADRLALNLSGAALDNHRNATRRLTAPNEMGTLFKAMAVYASNAPPPPGFD